MWCHHIYKYEVHSISFQTFFVWAFEIVVDSWKFTMLLLYILWDDWPIFYDFRFKWTATAGIGIHTTKAWLSQLVNLKMQSDTLEERYTIKFGFKLGKNVTETYGMLQTAFRPSCMNWASVFEWHKRFKKGRESVRDNERCGRSKEVRTPELIGQGVRVRIRVTMLKIKEVQEEIPSEEASTLQIGSVEFPPGQCTSPQLHPCHRLFDQDGHQDSSSPSL